ncbi:hypothetical protein ACIO3R_13325 [Streptomyces sp. NPDC087428]|uniref:hypothetical protein n=1 Tax=Streptomyces sp. NPDC087428 TaxID=3365788 RepID=UPI00380C1828
MSNCSALTGTAMVSAGLPQGAVPRLERPGPPRERVHEALREAAAARLAADSGTAPRSPADAAPGPGSSTAR